MRKYLLAVVLLIGTSLLLRPTSWTVFQAKAPADEVLPPSAPTLTPPEKVAKIERELIIAKMELQLYEFDKAHQKSAHSAMGQLKKREAGKKRRDVDDIDSLFARILGLRTGNDGTSNVAFNMQVPGDAIQVFQESESSDSNTKESKRKWFYKASDEARFAEWKKQKNIDFAGDSPPRTLMYTWCTEDTFSKFQNEVYWKSCYAHLHGFDVVFSSKKNFSGLAKWDAPIGLGQVGSWYSEENMWALWSDIQEYLKSGKYDYVFMMGADVLINGNFIDWPVWQWDRGHDVTVMDQNHFPYQWAYGLNENNILFKATNTTLDFIQEVFEFRKGFHLQGDNGPYMEAVLRVLGRWAESEGRMGYYEKCYEFCKLPKPSVLCMGAGSWWEKRNDDFDKCFFSELDRLTGGYGFRTSSVIGFYPTFIGFDGNARLPKEWLSGKRPYVPAGHPHESLQSPFGPWANCWSSVRKFWKEPWLNCFAYHWNGPKDPSKHSAVSGQCYDPTFNWETHKFNPANRQKPSA